MTARILVIDDDPQARKITSLQLSLLGHRVTTVSGGPQSMRIFDAILPDIVLTEIVLADRCGLEILRDIKRTRPQTRIIAMASHGGALEQSYLLDVARKLGADLALAKPIDAKLLQEAIAALERGPGQDNGCR
jgi:CheY-like chemotaxis protein